jgi:hypothetical protein
MWTEEINDNPNMCNGITDQENSLPIDDKILSKNWKVRLSGYEDLLGQPAEYVF